MRNKKLHRQKVWTGGLKVLTHGRSYNQGQKWWNIKAYLSVIFPAPHFNIDPHRTGADSTIKRNIETGVVRGISFLRQGFWDNDSMLQSTNT